MNEGMKERTENRVREEAWGLEGSLTVSEWMDSGWGVQGLVDCVQNERKLWG